jgi:dihydrofolate synthase/folylpolyglutamate synthase
VNYSEAIQFLYGLQMFGANFGLENTLKLAALAGNPQTQLRFIHVAGTNGKGSTCAMLESIYRAAGLRVGLFTSPHLVSFRERIQVNRQLIPESELVRLVEELRATNKQNEATLFEFATVMALKFFAEQKCDLVIWETGLGGRLDATNIVMPLAGVITNIAFDHQQWLGDTLEKIAAEKAGIIKTGIPVVTATDEPSALAVIEKIARGKNAPLAIIGRDAVLRRPDSAARCNYLSLPGEHQKLNAALALVTVDVLQKQIPVSEGKIREGLQNVNWPGRLQLIEKPDGQKILLDGAHNIAGVEALRAALKYLLPLPAKRGEGWGGGQIEKIASSPRPSPPFGEEREKPAFIVGVLGDKDWRPMCEILAPLAGKIFCVPVASARTADTRKLAAVCRFANPSVEIFVCSSLKEAFEKTGLRGCSPYQAENFIVITGSLYLVGEALELLGLSPTAENERALNEWRSKPATK